MTLTDSQIIDVHSRGPYGGVTNVNWLSLSMHPSLSEEFMEKYQDKLHWQEISTCQVLSDSFIERHAKKVIWQMIFRHQVLSESSIEKFIEYVEGMEKFHRPNGKYNIYQSCWNGISGYQVLSESFIEKHRDRVLWRSVSWKQKMSDEFMDKYADDVNWKVYYLHSRFCPPMIKIKYMRKHGYITTEGENDVLGYSERDVYLEKQEGKLKALDQLRELM
jgi:hypothetical protein